MSNPKFEDTQWSLVLRTRDAKSEVAREAVSRLCEVYWFPVYSFIRYKGNTHHAAQDLTQGFFVKVIQNGLFQSADRDRGRFRSFMMKSIDNFLKEGARFDNALKRGGGTSELSLDYERADRLYAKLSGSPESPEKLFDKYWAQTVLSRAENQLRDEYHERRKVHVYEVLHPVLYETGRHVNYEELGNALETSAGAVRTAAYRMRQRFGELIREEVSRTVSDPAEIESEIAHLMEALS